MPQYVDVILPIPVDRLFTYSIPSSMQGQLRPGMRLAVPFGKSKVYTGLAHRLHDNPPQQYEAKEVYQLLDEHALVTEVQLRHWSWVAQYYMCALGEVFRMALPAGFLLESETLVSKNPEAAASWDDQDDAAYLVGEALERQEFLRVGEIAAIIDKKNPLPLLHKLVALNLVVVQEAVRERYTPKKVRYIRLAAVYKEGGKLQELLEMLSRAPKQREVLLRFFEQTTRHSGSIQAKELEKVAEVSPGVVKALVDKGILEEFWEQTDRVVYEGDEEGESPKELNEYQQQALEDIQNGFASQKPVLLHGVTSSGKTEVYVKLLQQCLESGRQALYLLPEIALTAQLIERLQVYFGDSLSVYHSKYSIQERVEVWNNVLENKGKAQLIVGARSSLFLPFQDLGLILVDEEHEPSFKQYDPAPRYHARDAAVVLAKMQGAAIVLGSATPSLESYHNALSGKYALASITRRFGNVLMPEIEMVDLSEQYRKKRMKGRFSERLRLLIEEALKEREQVILFQNRRGFAPVVECMSCGHSPQCPNCDVSLTYHQKIGQLRCHYCGYHMAQQVRCLGCGQRTLDTKGFGTEQVEQELKEIFPDIRVGRMDLDTTRGKHAHKKIITAFDRHEYDVLVGTQMLTKGLDFRNVGLVGIMNADNLLNFPDFRAHERSFQLLTQVAGRAGRTQKRGKVIIQSYNPHHQILKQVSTYDYEGMFKEQLYERQQYKYPPSTRIIRVTFKCRDYNVLNEAASWFTQGLRNVLDEVVLGPEFPVVSRIRNQFLKHTLVKIKSGTGLERTKKSIKRVEQSFDAIAQYRSVRVIYNVDYI